MITILLKGDQLILPNYYIRNFGDINRYQRSVIMKALISHSSIPQHVIKEIVRWVDGFRQDEYRGITIIYPRLNLLCIYGCISVKLEDNQETEKFLE